MKGCKKLCEKLMLTLLVSCIGIIGCQKKDSPQSKPQQNTTMVHDPTLVNLSEVPPDSFLDTNVNASYQGVSGECKVTLRRFIDKGLNQPGSWKYINDQQWVYKISKSDPVTDKVTDISLLFKYEEIPVMANGSETKVGYVFLERVVTNGVDVSNSKLYDFFVKIAGNSQ